MAARKVEQTLESLRALRAEGPHPGAAEALRRSLCDPVNVVVAKAASIVAEFQIHDRIPDLLQALSRALEKPKADPQCWAKTAIVKALVHLGYDRAAPFLAGVRYVQMEPVWGGEEDSAAPFRSVCVLALLHCVDATRDTVLRCLVDALAEADPNTRTDAIRGIEKMGGDEATLLLRLKARVGDKDPAVTGQALESILFLEGDDGVPFVAEFLHLGQEQAREEAALALGVSRLPSAVDCLIDTFEKRSGRDDTFPLLRGLSASRTEHALAFLFHKLSNGRLHEARHALSALELHRDTAEILKRVADVLSARQDPELVAAFDRWKKHDAARMTS
jgi:hypothetical protein